MSTLRTVFKTLLQNDAALLALLTGGVSDAADHDIDGGSADSAPRAADGVTLLPHAKIRWRSATPLEPFALAPLRQTVEVYVYQHKGFTVIDAAVLRLRALLHNTYLQADDTKLNHVALVNTSGELPAPEYGNAPCRIVRFSVTYA